MNILEMHNTFRSIGQQMGMQTIRAIFSEDIDICLNNQIINTIREIVQNNTTSQFNGIVAVQRNPISPINSIRTLYTNKVINSVIGDGTDNNPYKINLDFDNSVMFYTGVVVAYPNKYNCRLINGDELNNTINDYCNRPTFDYPIAEFKKIDNDIVLEIITNDNIKKPINFEVRFIKLPNVVKLSETDTSVDCDLPEHLHYEIVNKAVLQYLNSINNTSNNV